MQALRLVFLMGLLVPGVLSAQESDDRLDELIAAVTAAYGGEALTALRNYEIVESYVSPNTGQSWHPALTDIGRFNFRLVRDLENARLYQESWFNARGGRFPNINVINNDGAWNINLLGSRYGAAANDDPYAIAGGIMRTTDTLLARELIEARGRDEAEYLGPASWINRSHERVKIPFPQSPDLTLYIDSETGLITRMTRDNPQIGLLDYVFADHRIVDGLTAAHTVNFSIAGVPNLMGIGRELRFNQSLNEDIFAIPDGLNAEGERLDDSDMVVNRLADNVYHIGQNGGFSIFVDTGSEIVAAGGYAGLSDRFARFRQETGNYRPLAYQVVTHHHQDHIGGIDEAVALGARLVTVEHTAPVLKAASALDIDDSDLLLVGERLTLGAGDSEVHLYDVSTDHSASNLLFYVPSTRTLFMADHFGGPFAEGVPVPTANTVSMASALEPLELGFRRIATAHSARIFTDRDFEAAVEAYRPFSCPEDRPLCSR